LPRGRATDRIVWWWERPRELEVGNDADGDRASSGRASTVERQSRAGSVLSSMRFARMSPHPGRRRIAGNALHLGSHQRRRAYAVTRLRRALMLRTGPRLPLLLRRSGERAAALARLLAAVEVRRPPRRLVDFVPTPMLWPRDDAPLPLRLADLIRLVAIVSTQSARRSVSSRRDLHQGRVGARASRPQLPKATPQRARRSRRPATDEAGQR
jgi:hypothetical protein